MKNIFYIHPACLASVSENLR